MKINTPKTNASGAARKTVDPVADTAFGRLLECKRKDQQYVPEAFTYDPSQKANSAKVAPGATLPHQPVAAFAADNGLPVSMLLNYVERGLITTLGEGDDLLIPVEQGKIDLKALWNRPKLNPRQAA